MLTMVWNWSTGSIMWSAVKTPMIASGSRRTRTAALNPTALSVSRPQGSPRNCSGPSWGRARWIAAACAAPADVASLRRHEARQTPNGDLQQAPSADQRNQLFGQRGPAHGPKPRPRTTGDGQCVSHRDVSLERNPCGCCTLPKSSGRSIHGRTLANSRIPASSETVAWKPRALTRA